MFPNWKWLVMGASSGRTVDFGKFTTVFNFPFPDLRGDVCLFIAHVQVLL
jgi:hypothetical protein